MRLILEANTNYRRKNLLMSNEVAIIIPDKYSNACFRDIVLVKHYTPNK